jgi:hypothetical protein
MTGSLSRLATIVALAAGLMTTPALAQDLPIAAFFGTFKGGGIAENRDSIYFGVTVRDFDVTIRPSGEGFTVEWATVIRKGGDPRRPKVRRKAQSATFIPTGRHGVYRATDLGDPLAGGRYAWARIEKQTLMVYLMTIDERGRYSMQSYARTLKPSGMDFVFQRIRDGEPMRTVKGKLIKYAR